MCSNAPKCTKMHQKTPKCTKMHQKTPKCTKMHQNVYKQIYLKIHSPAMTDIFFFLSVDVGSSQTKIIYKLKNYSQLNYLIIPKLNLIALSTPVRISCTSLFKI